MNQEADYSKLLGMPVYVHEGRNTYEISLVIATEIYGWYLLSEDCVHYSKDEKSMILYRHLGPSSSDTPHTKYIELSGGVMVLFHDGDCYEFGIFYPSLQMWEIVYKIEDVIKAHVGETE